MASVVGCRRPVAARSSTIVGARVAPVSLRRFTRSSPLLPTNGTGPLPQTPHEPQRNTLPRSRRIRRREDFVRVQEGGARVTTRHLLILLEPRADGPGNDPEARLGIVASRKVGGAVQRNRAKRLVRETFRRHANVFPRGFDVVVIVRPGVDALSQADVDAEIVGVAGLLRKRAGAKASSSPGTARNAPRDSRLSREKPRG